MARLFDDASDQYLLNSNAIVSAAPFAVSCWFSIDTLPTVAGNEFNLWSITPITGSSDNFRLFLNCWDSNRPVFNARFGSLDHWATASITPSLNTWYNVVCIAYAIDSRKIFANYSTTGTETTSGAPSSLAATRFARKASDAADSLSGMLAHVAFWNAALTDAEVLALARGADPRTIRPSALVAYWPLVRTDQDIVSGNNLTAYNTPTWSNDPGKTFGSAAAHIGMAAGAPPATVIPVMMHGYRLRGV